MTHQLSLPQPCQHTLDLPQTECVTHHHHDTESLAVPRRSAHYYTKNIWAHEFLDSLPNEYYKEKNHISRIEKLKDEVREMLVDGVIGSLARLELIDSIERIGVTYQFEKEIKRALDILWFEKGASFNNNDLHYASLYFRLLRQHGYQVSPDVFNGFKDNEGNFETGLCEDVKGMLSLYEASYLGLEGESIMDEAKSFTTKHLQLVKENIDSDLDQEVTHALELPLHWRMPRLESRWYIDAAQSLEKKIMNPSLLELAKLDFNLVQAIHQIELRNMSRWWRNLNLTKSTSFARDRLVESFICSVGLTYEPQHEQNREWITKVVSFIMTIDDIYDIYGSLDELELFTDAIERWETEAVDQLPDCMKMCYLALYNTINEMAYTAAYRDRQNLDILPYLRKVWEDFCKAMLLEAKWSKNGYTPSLKEYLNNAWISSSTPLALVHAFFATNQMLRDDVLECLSNNQEPIYSSSLILRLCNDLATSSAELERGDVPSAIQCYMRETNTSEGVARKNIQGLVAEAWKNLNKSVFESPFEHSFVKVVINLARTAHSIYQHGDGMSAQDHEVKERVKRLLVKPIDCNSYCPRSLFSAAKLIRSCGCE